jgi:hypothetical protein
MHCDHTNLAELLRGCAFLDPSSTALPRSAGCGHEWRADWQQVCKRG